jgi:DNA-binding NtrC family response regulator
VAVLQLGGFEVSHCRHGDEAVTLLGRNHFDIVIAEEGLRPVDGLAVLRAARAGGRDPKVIITAARPTTFACNRAKQLGAWHYLPKPFSATQLQLLVGLAANSNGRVPPHDSDASQPQPSLKLTRADTTVLAPIGRAPAFRQVIDLARRIAPIDIPVFLCGEAGSGKHTLARFIHRRSRRTARPMASIDCAALPRQQLESELERASGGTVFLHEVLALPKSAQARLVRVIEAGDVRIIAATSGDPERAVRDGRLREDLFYRLNVIQLRLPSLRERVEDIALLAKVFLTTHWRRHHPNTPVPKLSPRAIHAVSRLPWRGNLPELRNMIEWTAVSLTPGQEIESEDLPLAVPAVGPAAEMPRPAGDVLDEPLEAASARFLAGFEARYVQWVIGRADGNIANAARLAGVARATLYRMMHRHGLSLTRSTTWLPAAGPGSRERPSHLTLVSA